MRRGRVRSGEGAGGGGGRQAVDGRQLVLESNSATPFRPAPGWCTHFRHRSKMEHVRLRDITQKLSQSDLSVEQVEGHRGREAAGT